MIYIELQLGGLVRAYELSDKLILLKATILARGECVPLPETIEDAIEYMRSGCYGLEIFESFDEAEAWADTYSGFRAGEVRAELRRFYTRRQTYAAAAHEIAAA